MHSNLLFRAFLICVFLITIWYTITAIYRYHNYSSLSGQTRPLSMQFSVKEVAEDEFYLEASYTFQANGRSFTGKSDWPRMPYLNRWAAEKDEPYIEKTHQTVWFDPQNPKNSSLQNNFPFKECISAIFLWGLFLYFVWLGFYVTKFKT